MIQRTMLLLSGMLCLVVLFTQVAPAAGTAAGTPISNQASVDYTAGSNARNALSNTVTLYVAHYVTASFSPASRTENGVDNRTVYYAVDFVHQSNRDDAFDITFNSNTGYTVAMIDDLDGDGTFDAGEPVIASTGTLAPDATKKLLVRVQIAAGRPDAENVTITATLTSTAIDDGPSNVVVANPGASFNFSISYTVLRPVIVFTATQSNVTTNASRVPGANVTYTMTVDNTGSADVVGSSTVTFVLDPNFRYVSSTNSGALSGADGNGNGGTVTWSFTQAELAAAQPAINFDVVVQPEQVTVNATGVVAGTAVYAMTTAQSTQTKVSYNDGVNGYDQDNANSFTFNVGTASGTVITQVTPDGSGNPDDVVEYTYTLKNTGNHSDNFDFTQANDVSGDLDVAHVFSLTPAGASVTSISAVAQGATVNFYARVTIPSAATDGQTIKRDLTATTQTASPDPPTGGSISSTDNLITTVLAPAIAIVLAGGESDIISGGVGGRAVPGTVMRWTVTITNTGTGTATNISSSNVNAHVVTNVVVPTSVDIDVDGDGTYELVGVALPYSSGGVSASLAGGVLTVGFPSVSSGIFCRYRYNVTVQ